MSTISATGLSQLYQSFSVSSPVQQPDVTTDASSATGADATQQTQTQAPHHHHHGGGGQFFSKIEAAVTNALQSAQSGTDPNQAIQNAIESIFKNGNDPTSSDSTGNSTDPTATTDPTASTDPTATTSIDPQAAREQFFQTLQTYGIDPQQFHQDFLGAIQDAQNGNADVSSVFKSFPPGTVVDQTA